MTRSRAPGARAKALAAILLLAAVFRLAWLGSDPPGLFCDEGSIVYDAWSLAQHGTDQWGARHPLFFESFGEYKNPIYVYADVPFAAALGMTPLAARLPAALLGILTVWLGFLLAEEWLGTRVALFAALFLAIEPWGVTQSRIAFEAIALPPLLALALLALTRGLRRGSWGWSLAGGVALGATVYAYSIAAVLGPLVFLAFAATIGRETKAWSRLAAAGGTALAVALPGAIARARVSGRFDLIGVSSLALWPYSVQRWALHHLPAALSRAVESSPAAIRVWAIAYGYGIHLAGGFLFLHGDPNSRHGVPMRGLLLFAEMPFLMAGAITAWQRRREPAIRLLAAIVLIAPVPAALTLEGLPHSIRFLGAMPALSILVALGAERLFEAYRPRPWIVRALAAALCLDAAVFAARYFTEYRNEEGRPWQQDAKVLVDAVAARPQVCGIAAPLFEHFEVFWGIHREAPPEEVARMRSIVSSPCPPGSHGELLTIVPQETLVPRSEVLATAHDGLGRPTFKLVRVTTIP